jgi:4-amino-4-deoxy-L-arabinose transferase-like glycosyltransferase
VTPSFVSYVGGCFAVIGIACAVGLGGYWLRRWIVPEFSGALARLADATIAVALLVLSLELLGTLSILRTGWIVVVCIAIGLLAALLGRRMAPRDGRQVSAPPVQTIALLIALGVASFTVAEWTFPSQLSLDQGMFGGDTTWYHMPFAARIAQEHSTVHLHFTDPLRLAAWFYPQSSELIHGSAIVLFKTDWLSPLINLVWLSIALLAAWCVGRPYKVGPATLVAAALVLDSGVMIETQPGEGRNDIMGLAFLIAFAAFLINAHQRRAPDSGAVQDTPERDAPLLDKGPLVIAGLAAGLAASVKLTFLIPVAVIGVGVVLFSGRGRRITTAWVLGLAAFVAGGYWYMRAAIKTGGNPIPQLGFGPLHLPRPDQMPLDPRPRFAVSHYLTQPTIYRKWFFPQLDNALGPLWPLILIVAVAAAVYVAWRSRNVILRVIAVAALVTAAVYVFTPLTAAGQEGSPTGFFTNTRYLIPGLVLALTLLPIARPLRAPDRRAWQTLLFLTAVYAITVLTTPKWYPSYIVGTIFITLALVWAPAGLGLLRGRDQVSRAVVAVAGAAILLLAVVLGRAQEVQYYDHHYTKTTLFLQEGGPQKAYEFARKQHHKRIGIAGSGEIFFGQYGYYGANLDNYVQYIGVPGADGAYRLATSCRQFRRRINAGDYDFLVVSQYTQDSPDAPYWYPIYAWLKTDPELEKIIEEPEVTPEPDYVFKVKGKLDPAGCAGLGSG